MNNFYLMLSINRAKFGTLKARKTVSKTRNRVQATQLVTQVESSVMAETKNKHAQPQPKNSWSVVAIYQDEQTRARAVAVCDQLVGRFWAQIEFQFQWVEFDKLTAPVVSGDAATASAGADIVVCAVRAEEQIPPHVATWFDEFVRLRARREGAFIALVGWEGDPLDKRLPRLCWLREVARRAGMDFLSEAAPTGSWAIPESLQWLHQRADQLSPILSEILDRPTTPFTAAD